MSKEIEKYPNLEAVLEGRCCGSPKDWGMLRTEIRKLFSALKKAEGELNELKSNMGSDQTLAEVLYEYHQRAEKAEEQVAKLSDEKLNRHEEVMMWVEKCEGLEGDNKGLRNMISDYQRSCKGWEELSVVSRDRIKQLEEGIGYAIHEFIASGLWFDHPTVVKLQKLIEKGDV